MYGRVKSTTHRIFFGGPECLSQETAIKISSDKSSAPSIPGPHQCEPRRPQTGDGLTPSRCVVSIEAMASNLIAMASNLTTSKNAQGSPHPLDNIDEQPELAQQLGRSLEIVEEVV